MLEVLSDILGVVVWEWPRLRDPEVTSWVGQPASMRPEARGWLA